MILIRHGEKAWKNGKGPHDDPPLLPSAKDTIISTSKGIGKYLPTALVCSPYLRCQQTAKLLQETFPTVPIIVDDLLREYHKHPPHLRRGSRVPKIGESKEEFQQRIQLIKQKYEHKQVLIITHRPVIQALTGKHVKQGKSLIT
ncbi:MAG: histidine phosphatase family protein [Nitrososphaerales archaeon]